MTFESCQRATEEEGGTSTPDCSASNRYVVDHDANLVGLARAGDQGAFEALMRKYQQRITRRVSHYVKRPADVEDLVQEIFVKAYRGLASFKSQSTFYTWLYRIATNAALNHVTRQRHTIVLRDDLCGNEDGEANADFDARDEADPERELLAKQIVVALEGAMARLQPDLAEALLLYEVDGMQYKEIATQLRVPIGTVRTRIFRAREFIAERLTPASSAGALRPRAARV